MVEGESNPGIERAVSFTDRCIDAFASALQDHSFQRSEALRAQLQGLEGYFVKGSRLEKEQPALCRELRRQFPSGGRAHFNFLNELLKKSLGVQLHYNNKDKTFTSVKKSMPLVPDGVPVVDLLRLAEQYEPPAVRFDPASSAPIGGDGDQESPTTIQLRASFVSNPLSVVFDSRFEKAQVCTKNKNDHSLATYQDAADQFSHRLRVEAERMSSSDDVSYSVLEAELFECEGDSILVEGAYGDLPENQEEPIFDYLYACLIKYAYETGKSLQFNLSFNPRSQAEPIKFINYVSRRLHGRTLYLLDDGEYRIAKEAEPFIRESQRQLRALTLRSPEAKKSRKRLAKNLEGIVNDSTALFDAFSYERRYADSWQPYEFNVRKNHDKPQWNLREGEVACLEIDPHQLKKEYSLLFGKQKMSLVEKALLGAVSALAAGALALWLGYNKPTICEYGIVDRNTIICSAATGTKELPIEELGGLGINGKEITGKYNNNKYRINLQHEGDVKNVLFALEKMRLYGDMVRDAERSWSTLGLVQDQYREERAIQKIKGKLYRKYNKRIEELFGIRYRARSNLFDVIAAIPDLSLAMRVDHFIDSYGFDARLTTSLMTEMRGMLDAGVDAEKISDFINQFSQPSLVPELSLLERSLDPSRVLHFLQATLAMKDRRIHDHAIYLVSTDTSLLPHTLSRLFGVLGESAMVSVLQLVYDLGDDVKANRAVTNLIEVVDGASVGTDQSSSIKQIADTLKLYVRKAYFTRISRAIADMPPKGETWSNSSRYYHGISNLLAFLRHPCVQQRFDDYSNPELGGLSGEDSYVYWRQVYKLLHPNHCYVPEDYVTPFFEDYISELILFSKYATKVGNTGDETRKKMSDELFVSQFCHPDLFFSSQFPISF